MDINTLDTAGQSRRDNICIQEGNSGVIAHGNHGGVARHINNVCNLPVEIWQKIACNLDYESYNALRCTSKQTREIMPISTLFHRISDKNVRLTADVQQDYRKCLSQHSFLTFLTSFSPLSRYLISRVNISCIDFSPRDDTFAFKINLLSELSNKKDDITVTHMMDEFKNHLYARVPNTLFRLVSTVTFSNVCLQNLKNKNLRDTEPEQNRALFSDTLEFYFTSSAFYPGLSGVSNDKASENSEAVKPHIAAVFDCLQKYTQTLNHREQVLMQVIGHKLYHFCLENSEPGLPRNSMVLALKPFSAFLSACAKVDRMVNYVLDSPAPEGH